MRKEIDIIRSEPLLLLALPFSVIITLPTTKLSLCNDVYSFIYVKLVQNPIIMTIMHIIAYRKFVNCQSNTTMDVNIARNMPVNQPD